MVVLPHLTSFLKTYPAVTLELDCDNALVDLVAAGFDAGIRLGENLSQDVVAVPLGGLQRLATIASPCYLSRRDLPRTPADLIDHRCVKVRPGEGLYRWEYVQEGRRLDVDVGAALIARDGDTLLSAVRSGAGIGVALESQVQDDLASGRLIALLEPWRPTFPGFHLYHASRSNVPGKLRVFIDFFRNALDERSSIAHRVTWLLSDSATCTKLVRRCSVPKRPHRADVMRWLAWKGTNSRLCL